MKLDIVVVGLTITSSWGNGHATTYRALLKALAARGHHVTFLERDVPWYREHRDLPTVSYCDTKLYRSLREFQRRHGRLIAEADLVILGSYVPDGAVMADWITSNARGVTAFYDIDTPVTLARLENGDVDYITAALIPRFDLYLSFTGGPVLDLLENGYGSPRARPLYCAVDPELHSPVKVTPRWRCGYIGTYSADRQANLERLFIEAARQLPHDRFVVAGPQYPAHMVWPPNVESIVHLPPDDHAAFYCAQAFTLNLTRAEMLAAGYSPSVRLFEAAACGVPIITDRWPGLSAFFEPGKEIVVADTPEEVVLIISSISDDRRLGLSAAARQRVLQCHTADRRAKDLEGYYLEVVERHRPKSRVEAVA
jgi:spore maturation protein CgeB